MNSGRLNDGAEHHTLDILWPFVRANLHLLDQFVSPSNRSALKKLHKEALFGNPSGFNDEELRFQIKAAKEAGREMLLPTHVFPVVLSKSPYPDGRDTGAIVPILAARRPPAHWEANQFVHFLREGATERDFEKLLANLESSWPLPLPLWGRRGLSLSFGIDIDPKAIIGRSLELPLLIVILRECCFQATGHRPFGETPVFATGKLGGHGQLENVHGVRAKLEAFLRECGDGNSAILLREQKETLPTDLVDKLSYNDIETLEDLTKLPQFRAGLDSLSASTTPEEFNRLRKLQHTAQGRPGVVAITQYLVSHSGDDLADSLPRIDGLVRNNLPGWKGDKNQSLIGRDNELALLTEAFHDPLCSILCIIAEGGYGKSALITRWLEEMRDMPSAGHYGNVQVGFAYSFYKQGWERQSAASSTLFFQECLISLSGLQSDQLPTGGADAWATAILQIIRQRSALLLLDGLEPHQSSISADPPGEIRDNTLKQFIKGISASSGGLCVITSRIMPAELKGPLVDKGRVRILHLDRLGYDASIQMLKEGGITIDHPDLSYWATESEGHPLLLALLAPAIAKGNYDPRTFESHRVLVGNKQDIPKTIKNFVLSQLKPLGPEAQAVLLSASLFDKPVSYKELRDLLISRAIIPKITEPFFKPPKLLRRRRFSQSLFIKGAELLEKAAMLTVVGSLDNLPDSILELHPLIQAGVRGDLVEHEKKIWRRANWTIYKSLINSVKPWQPDTRKELERLYAAVPHGVNAGKGWVAGWMYANRCLRGFRGYSTIDHGMIADDVVALSHYFEGNWATLKEDIGLSHVYGKVQAHVWAGTLLTAVNRWNEGRPLMNVGMDLAKESGDFPTAARTARNLGMGHAIAGDLIKGEEFVRQSIDLLESRRPLHILLVEYIRARSFKLVNLAYERTEARATLGSILHYQGNFEEAQAAFRDAEQHQVGAINFPSLRGLPCFRQVEMLLDREAFDEADDLITRGMLNAGEPAGWGERNFVLALLKLGFVRTRIRRMDVVGQTEDWDRHKETATNYAKEFAEFGQRQKLQVDWLVPLFKIAVSGIERLSLHPSNALVSVEEAEQHASHFSNILFETDVYLEWARVHLALNNAEGARVCVRKANSLSDTIRYRCKAAEVARVSALCG